MQGSPLKPYIRRLASEVGFERCGIAAATPTGRADYVRSWLNAGRAGTMGYLHRHLEERLDPRLLLPGAKSVIVVAMSYYQNEPAAVPTAPGPTDPQRGRVAMYAWGDDYHDVMRSKLRALADRMRAELPEPFDAKVCVDTAPLLEREAAAAAGLGWIGKNTLVLDREWGSYAFLGALVTTLDMEPDSPVADHCGTCTACLDACPTQAFPAPYEMDASRCISYLTIEHRGEIAAELQAPMGDWLFGCDVCQQVCPYNRRPEPTQEPRFAVRPSGPSPRPDVDELLAWTTDDYRRVLRGSAAKRANVDMWRRNAAIAKTNLTREDSLGDIGDRANSP